MRGFLPPQRASSPGDPGSSTARCALGWWKLLVAYSKVVGVGWGSCMDAFGEWEQNTDTMEEGDRSEIVPQPVRHGFNAALLIGLTVRFGDGLRRWAKEQAVPFLP